MAIGLPFRPGDFTGCHGRAHHRTTQGILVPCQVQHGAIMRRVDQALSRQRHDLVADRAEHRTRIALLEVSAAGAADHEAIACEREAGVIENIRQAATGMARCGAHLKVPRAERDPVVVAQQPVGAFRSARGRHRDLATELALEPPGAGDVIGVNVGLERRNRRESQLAQQGRIALPVLEHGIDHQRLARRGVAQKIGVGGRGGIEQLPENHDDRPRGR